MIEASFTMHSANIRHPYELHLIETIPIANRFMVYRTIDIDIIDHFAAAQRALTVLPVCATTVHANRDGIIKTRRYVRVHIRN